MTTAPSRTTALPPTWRVVWIPDRSDAPAGALELRRWRVSSVARSTAMAFWRHRLEPWERTGFPLGEITIALAEFPHLDEIWTLWMMANEELRVGGETPTSWEAMCRYVEDVRQGLSHDKAPATHTLQGVYRAMTAHHLDAAKPTREAFLDAALAFSAMVSRKLEAGAQPLVDDFCAREPALAQYVALLSADEKLYREDLARRSRRFWAELREGSTPGAARRRLPLLVLDRPVSTGFKAFARTDPLAPGGDGYPLLLVSDGKNNVILSADPTARASVGFLAEGLSDAEKDARGGPAAPWYDGRDHDGTLVASPRDGTFFSLDQVLDRLRAPLRLRPIRDLKRPRNVAGALLAATAVAGFTAWALHKNPIGAPLATSDVRAHTERFRKPPFALVAGACDYDPTKGKFPRLKFACADARAFRNVLIEHYGYPPENIIYLVDREEPGALPRSDGKPTVDGRPTVAAMRKGILALRDRHPPVPPDSTFIFYYSGHGQHQAGGRSEWGYLVAADYWTEPEETRYWDMQQIAHDIEKYLSSKRVLVLLDNCHSGFATRTKGAADVDGRVHERWNEPVDVILTASNEKQESMELLPSAGQHGAFTQSLLDGLERRDGKVAADTTADGVVTDEELFAYVAGRLDHYRATDKEIRQTPQFQRMPAGGTETMGQFLLVPR